MLNGILTEQVFRDGLFRYLTHYSEGNANSDKLWDSLNQVNQLIPLNSKKERYSLRGAQV